MQGLLRSVPPTLQQATADPHLRQRLLNTHGQVWVSLLWGSLLLSPGSWCTQSFVCALQESVSPVLCKFWQLYCGVNGNHLPRGLMQYPGLLYPKPLPLRQSTADLYLCRRHSNTVLSQSLWGLWVLVAQGLFEPSERLWQVWGLILNVTLPLLPSCWGFSFALRHGVSPQSCSSAAPNSNLSLYSKSTASTGTSVIPAATNATFCRSSIRSIPEKLEPAPKCHRNSN